MFIISYIALIVSAVAFIIDICGVVSCIINIKKCSSENYKEKFYDLLYYNIVLSMLMLMCLLLNIYCIV